MKNYTTHSGKKIFLEICGFLVLCACPLPTWLLVRPVGMIFTHFIGIDIRALLMWWFQRQHWRLIKGMFPKSSPLHLEGHPSIWQLWNLSLSWSINLWRQLPRPRASCQVRNSSCRICHPSQTGQLCHLRQRRSQAHCKNMRGIPLLCYIDLTVWEIMVKIVTPKTTHFYQLPSLTLWGCSCINSIIQ